MSTRYYCDRCEIQVDAGDMKFVAYHSEGEPFRYQGKSVKQLEICNLCFLDFNNWVKQEQKEPKHESK